MKYKILFFFFFSVTAFSQPITEDIKHFFVTGKNVFTAPLEWHTNDLLNLTGTLVLTSGAFALDNSIKSFANRNRSSFNDVLFDADGAYFVAQAAAGMGGVYLYGLVFEDKEIRKLGLNLGEAVVYASVVTTVFKTVIGRSRPYVEAGNHKFNFAQISFAKTSFPSGHSTIAFAISTVMANYSDNIFWKTGWYTAAGVVAGSRIYHDKHWLSDVILGSAIGHFVAEYVVNGSEEKNKIELGIMPSGVYLRVAL